jgi:hypothetical protein
MSGLRETAGSVSAVSQDRAKTRVLSETAREEPFSPKESLTSARAWAPVISPKKSVKAGQSNAEKVIMNKESFLETLRDQYREEIREAHIESEHHQVIDFPSLNRSLNQLMKTAKYDGLSRSDFEELVKNTLPEAALGKIDILTSSANKAVKKSA